MQAWVEEELRTADLGDKRLTARFKLLIDRMSHKPSLKFPAACRGRAEVKAAYRFVDHPRVTAEQLLAPHRQSTIQRVAHYPVVILAQDTTENDLSRRRERMAGAGPLNDPARLGLLVHPLFAITPERLPLGLVDVAIWARDPEAVARPAKVKDAERHKKPIEEKESFCWLKGYRQACVVAQACPETQIICISDSDGDIFECYFEAEAARTGRKADWIVRASDDRELLPSAQGEALAGKLFSQVASRPVLAKLKLEVSYREAKSHDGRKRKKERSARTARVNVQAAHVKLKQPRRRDGKDLTDVAVNAILVRETEPPEGEEPIEWLLLTSLPIRNRRQVLAAVEYYCCRWQIEVYFRVLESACKVEASQLETAQGYEAYLALSLIVAWRVMYLLMLGRVCPELPCERVLEADEWQAVYAVMKEQPPPSLPLLGEMVSLIAKLGGYLGRKCDGPPGPKAMWIGMQRMTDLALGWRAHTNFGNAVTADQPPTEQEDMAS
jgi:hypothetical protein